MGNTNEFISVQFLSPIYAHSFVAFKTIGSIAGLGVIYTFVEIFGINEI